MNLDLSIDVRVVCTKNKNNKETRLRLGKLPSGHLHCCECTMCIEFSSYKGRPLMKTGLNQIFYIKQNGIFRRATFERIGLRLKEVNFRTFYERIKRKFRFSSKNSIIRRVLLCRSDCCRKDEEFHRIDCVSLHSAVSIFSHR